MELEGVRDSIGAEGEKPGCLRLPVPIRSLSSPCPDEDWRTAGRGGRKNKGRDEQLAAVRTPLRLSASLQPIPTVSEPEGTLMGPPGGTHPIGGGIRWSGGVNEAREDGLDVALGRGMEAFGLFGSFCLASAITPTPAHLQLPSKAEANRPGKRLVTWHRHGPPTEPPTFSRPGWTAGGDKRPQSCVGYVERTTEKSRPPTTDKAPRRQPCPTSASTAAQRGTVLRRMASRGGGGGGVPCRLSIDCYSGRIPPQPWRIAWMGSSPRLGR